MTSDRLGSGESKLEGVISYLLIIGVVVSLFLEIIGMAIFYHSYGHLGIGEDKSLFIQGQNFFSFIYGLFQGKYAKENALLFMTIGIIILMLTPYVRVIASVLYFAWKKNVKYVLITLFVLVVLTISLALH